MTSAKLCKRKRNDTAACREDREIKIIRKSDCAQTRSLADRGHIDRFEKKRNGGIIYIKTRPKPFPCKKTIKLESARRKNRFDGFPVPPPLFRPRHFVPAISSLLFRPAISPRYFAPLFRPAILPCYYALLLCPAIMPPLFRANKTTRKAKEKAFAYT